MFFQKLSIIALAVGVLASQHALAANPTYQFRSAATTLKVAAGSGATTNPTTPTTPTTPTAPTGPSKPVIVSMQYEVPYVSNRPYQSNYLTWSTTGADSATVVCSGLAVGQESGTSGEMWPEVVGNRTTGIGTCTLTATNAAGSTTMSKDFTAVAPAVVTAAFTAPSAKLGQPNTLQWSATGATSVTVACSSSRNGVTTQFTSQGLSGQLVVTAGDYGGACRVRAFDLSTHDESRDVFFSLAP